MESAGRHSRLDEDERFAPLRYVFRPRTALGVAAVLVLLTVVGVVRVITWSPSVLPGQSAEVSIAAQSEHAGEGTRVELDAENLAEGDAQMEGEIEGALRGYGLAAAGGNGAEGPEIFVHVTGAVKEPGVVHLVPGSRVLDAVDAAGGLTQDAQPSAVNLAAFAADGSQVHVPAAGESVIAEAPGTQGTAPDLTAKTGSCVDLNVASESELQELDGVGPKLAARIVEYRNSHGLFASSDDLTAVSGIGSVLSSRIAAGACQ